MGEHFVETYRGCDIWYMTPPHVSTPQYRSDCISGGYSKLSAVKKRICKATGGVWEDDKCTAAPPPEPPPEEEPELAETYRGVEIWWVPSLEIYRAEVEPGYTATGTTLTEIREEINDTLDFLYPPEDPAEGLFAQVVASVKAWIIENMPDWVIEWGEVIYETINNVYQTINNVYTYVTEEITNVINNTYKYITNTYNEFREYITNVYNNITENITQVFNNTYQYVTNVVGASVEWVEEKITNIRSYVDQKAAAIDTVGFFEDPLGYIGTAFTGFLDAWIDGTVGSFAEGLQIGLVGNPPEPEGPGAAFKEGFNSVINEKEGHTPRG